ncbi:hypothetical protein WMY93_022350 [Mugilogobius chulae]|uniref:C-type lectin domain-containing protein n=1 Tax=Mugilogobius chulae TaxID=88201 RepID=A0AAW0N8A6_9GOBI
MGPYLRLVLLVGIISAALAKYVYIDKKKHWDEAHAYCVKEFTDLAPVYDYTDLNLLRSLAGDHKGFIWFGLMRNMTDLTKWMWSGGGEVTWFNWDYTQPNPDQSEHYGAMNKENKEDMTSIQDDLYTVETTEHVWIGLRFLAGDWLWLDGHKSEYEAWSSGGKPKCPGEKLACGALVSKGDVWEARNCEEKLHFICD